MRNSNSREGRGREGKGREGKGREGKGREDLGGRGGGVQGRAGNDCGAGREIGRDQGLLPTIAAPTQSAASHVPSIEVVHIRNLLAHLALWEVGPMTISTPVEQ